jgi:hypothetical protein
MIIDNAMESAQKSFLYLSGVNYFDRVAPTIMAA